MTTIDYIGFDIHKKTISFCAKAQDGTILEEGTIPALRKTPPTACVSCPALINKLASLAGTPAAITSCTALSCPMTPKAFMKKTHVTRIRARRRESRALRLGEVVATWSTTWYGSERTERFLRALSFHHINHDKLDNRIENLQLLDVLAHKRHHSGCEQREGTWWKPCRKCGAMKPVSEYHRNGQWILSWCKSCQSANAVRNKQKRRARKMQQSPLAA